MDIGHAKADDGRAGGRVPHGRELLVGGGEGGLDCGDLAEPALLLRFGEAVDQVGVDLFEPVPLSWVNPRERTYHAGVFMRARGSVVAAADSERDLPQLEMGEELGPLGGGEVAVFLAGPLRPAAR
ncbi:hypothetical protein [Embleya sp. NPDC001921]